MSSHPTRGAHAARVFLHRWYAFTERDTKDLAPLLELLSEGIHFRTQAGESRGKKKFVQRLGAMPVGHQRAHRVKSYQYRSMGADAGEATVELTFQDVAPDGTQSHSAVRYGVEMRERPGALPLVERLDIQPTGRLHEAPFLETYSEHRSRSTFHRWLHLFELNSGDAEPFRELLADRFELRLGSGQPLSRFEQLATYLAGVPRQLAESRNFLDRFESEALPDGRYAVKAEFSWQGQNVEGQALAARTAHRWMLRETGQTYARIERLDMNLIEPYRLVR